MQHLTTRQIVSESVKFKITRTLVLVNKMTEIKIDTLLPWRQPHGIGIKYSQ